VDSSAIYEPGASVALRCVGENSIDVGWVLTWQELFRDAAQTSAEIDHAGVRRSMRPLLSASKVTQFKAQKSRFVVPSLIEERIVFRIAPRTNRSTPGHSHQHSLFSSFIAMKQVSHSSPIILALALGAGAIYQFAEAADPAPSASTTLKRGEYLVSIGGCHDCHTPFKMGDKGPEPDMTRALSGHPAEMKLPPPPTPVGPWIWHGAATNTAFAGPWGISYSANLTSDKVTGIGNWKLADFVGAMRTGKHLGVGRPIMPPMPWQGYAKMTDSDLKAVFAYLQSAPAISNRVPDHQAPAGK
jgi:mono/diheme cytochrome c family protein